MPGHEIVELTQIDSGFVLFLFLFFNLSFYHLICLIIDLIYFIWFFSMREVSQSHNPKKLLRTLITYKEYHFII